MQLSDKIMMVFLCSTLNDNGILPSEIYASVGHMMFQKKLLTEATSATKNERFDKSCMKTILSSGAFRFSLFMSAERKHKI